MQEIHSRDRDRLRNGVRLLQSFLFAVHGLSVFFRTQLSGRIQAGIAVTVILAGIFFGLNGVEWCLVLLAIGMVLGAEALNTAVEFLSDAVSPGYHPLIRNVKDLAAASVLIVASVAVLVGAIIFTPHLNAILRSVFRAPGLG